jgi:hypothetical protein
MHPLEDCPHNETFRHIGETLGRLDRHTERTAIAMEEMAAQGAILKNHEARLNVHEKDIDEAFERIRVVERKHDKEDGIQVVKKQRAKFWDGIKQQTTPYAFTVLFFVLWLADRFNVFQFFCRMFKEMKG